MPEAAKPAAMLGVIERLEKGFCRKFPGRTRDTRGYDGLYPASE